MRIAIMGSGGVGAYVGAWLQQAGHTVHFIARGAHGAALQANGLRIEHPDLPLHLAQVSATADPARIGAVDLVVFAVKLFDTAAALQQMAPLVGAGTRVLTLQNGIDSEAALRAGLPAGTAVRAGVIYLSAVIDRPGVIRSPGGFHAIVADRADGDPVMAELAATTQALPGLDVTLVEDARQAVWQKFVTLASMSGATALLRARMGPILGHPDSRAFLRQLVDEVVAVATASGVALPPDQADAVMQRLAGSPPSFRSSMAEDLERGNRLELPWLSGRVHALGRSLGVPTPAHSAVQAGLVLWQDGPLAG